VTVTDLAMTDRPGVPRLPDTSILLVEVGSTAHGTGIPGGEDHDEIGVVVEPPHLALGLSPTGMPNTMQRNQPEGTRSGPGDTDRTLYSLRSFCRLAAAGNPSILMTFWSPVEYATDLGTALQALGPAFVGRHIVDRYRGYMRGQAERLLGTRGGGHGRRGGGRRPELEAAHGFDTKYAMHAARLGFQCIELLKARRLRLPIEGEPGDWLRAVRAGHVPFDEWWARVLELDSQMEALADDSGIQQGPDRERIEMFMVDAHRRTWGWA
jgi:hypothetical protein